jgi:hypothetical protein
MSVACLCLARQVELEKTLEIDLCAVLQRICILKKVGVPSHSWKNRLLRLFATDREKITVFSMRTLSKLRIIKYHTLKKI